MKKILIVDDMMVSLMMTENMLSGEYKTFCASSGQEAMEIYRRELPDMVLSDLRMPGMSGYELQQTLQSEMGTTIPFMFMTADQDEETETKGFDNGAMDFIRKPFRPDVLLRRVGNILQTIDQIQGLKKHASIDSLTGLLNKSGSEEELTAICQNSVGVLMMIDLDSFKLVNDLYGHSMGDKILMSFADIIRAAMRPTDLVGRLGGDEFIAFCRGMLDEGGIAHKAEYINDSIVKAAKELMGDNMNIPLGASIGCVFVPTEGTDFAELFKKADKALYKVKQNGKHGYSIFAGHKKTDDTPAATGIAKIEQILGERNVLEGALALPMESFQALYRFMKRNMRDTSPIASLVFFYLDRGEIIASDDFFDVLKKTLRKGDVVSHSGNNQFLALLFDTGEAGLLSAVERLKQNWAATQMGAVISFSYEWTVLQL